MPITADEQTILDDLKKLPQEEWAKFSSDELKSIDDLISKSEKKEEIRPAPLPEGARIETPLGRAVVGPRGRIMKEQILEPGESIAEIREARGVEEEVEVKMPGAFEMLAKPLQAIGGALAGEEGIAGQFSRAGLKVAGELPEAPTGLKGFAEDLGKLLVSPLKGAYKGMIDPSTIKTLPEHLKLDARTSLKDVFWEAVSEAQLRGDDGEAVFWATADAALTVGAAPENIIGLPLGLRQAKTLGAAKELIKKYPKGMQSGLEKIAQRGRFEDIEKFRVAATEQATKNVAQRLAKLPERPLQVLEAAEAKVAQRQMVEAETRRLIQERTFGKPIRIAQEPLRPFSFTVGKTAISKTAGVDVTLTDDGLPIFRKIAEETPEPVIQVIGTSIKPAGVQLPQAVEQITKDLERAMGKSLSSAQIEQIAKRVALSSRKVGGNVRLPSSKAVESAAAQVAAENGVKEPGIASKFFEIEGKIGEPEPSVVIGRGRIGKAGEAIGVVPRETIIRRAGKSGEVFVDEARKSVVVPEAKAADLNLEIEDIFKRMNPTQDQKFRLKEALEGRRAPEPDVVEAFDVMDKHRRLILNLKKSQTPDFGIENYYHHEIVPVDQLKSGPMRDEVLIDVLKRGRFNDPVKAAESLDHYIKAVDGDRFSLNEYLKGLVEESGGKMTFEDAARRWDLMMKRRVNYKYGAFEPRELDIPWFDPDPFRVMPEYNKRALRDLYITERFGKGREGLIKMANEVDRVLNFKVGSKSPAQVALDFYLGRSTPDEYGALTKALGDFQIITKMSLSSIANYFQGFTGSALRTNVAAAFKGQTELLRNHEVAVRWAKSVGRKPEMAALFMEPQTEIAKKFLGSWLSGKFQQTELNNYITATTSGRYYAKVISDQFLKNPKDAVVRNRLRQLGVDPDKVLANKGLSLLDYKLASETVWREGQAIPDIFNQPHQWLGFDTTHPGVRLFRQFQSTAYAQSLQTVKRLFTDKGHRVGNLFKLTIMYPVVGEIINTGKGLVGARRETEGFWDRYFNDFQAAFALGLLGDIYSYSQYGIPAGPTISDLETLLRLPGKPGKIPEEIAKRVPIIGRGIGKELKKSRQAREDIMRSLELDIEEAE